MDFNIEIRKKQLDNLDQLISSSRDRIQSVLNYLDWSSENVKKEDHLVQCPLNLHHKIHPKSWNEHLEKCIIQIEGYNQKSQFLSEPVDSSKQSIYLDHNKKIELITKELEKGPLRLAWNGLDPDPRTADRMLSTYSSDERLIFYNYSVENTAGPPELPEFTTLLDKKQEKEKPLTDEDILKQKRDAKRRRIKYKSVHINRKNHTEVIREVINSQMEEYKEWLLAQEQTKRTEECNSNNGIEEEKRDYERSHSSISRNSNHSSSSRSTSRKDHYREKREKSSERKYRNYERKYDDKYGRRRKSHSRERERRHSRERERRHSKERRRSPRPPNRARR